VGLLLGALLGLLNAAIIVRLRIEPLIATLGTSFIYTSAAVAAAGDAPPSGFPDSFNALGSQAFSVGGIAGLVPYQLMLFAVLVALFWLLVGRSAFGRKLVTVGYNVEAARYSGIRVNRIIVTAYAVSGLMAALAGLVLAAYYSAVRPDMGDVLLLTTITMVVLGGVSIFGGEGTIGGVVVAVLLLGFLRQGMLIAGFSDMVTTMLTGAILLVSIAVKNLLNPRGGGLRNLLRALGSRPKTTRDARQ
jgi:ribose/xylose/arabinose/galactoside ABC-type transport system permease subunit